MQDPENLYAYFDAMDPGFPDRGTKADQDAYLRKRKAKMTTGNPPGGVRVTEKGCLPRPIINLTGDDIEAAIDRATKPSKVKKLEDEIARLRGLIDQAKKESELITYKGKPQIMVPYWFIKI